MKAGKPANQRRALFLKFTFSNYVKRINGVAIWNTQVYNVYRRYIDHIINCREHFCLIRSSYVAFFLGTDESRYKTSYLPSTFCSSRVLLFENQSSHLICNRTNLHTITTNTNTNSTLHLQ